MRITGRREGGKVRCQLGSASRSLRKEPRCRRDGLPREASERYGHRRRPRREEQFFQRAGSADMRAMLFVATGYIVGCAALFPDRDYEGLRSAPEQPQSCHYVTTGGGARRHLAKVCDAIYMPPKSQKDLLLGVEPTATTNAKTLGVAPCVATSSTQSCTGEAPPTPDCVWVRHCTNGVCVSELECS